MPNPVHDRLFASVSELRKMHENVGGQIECLKHVLLSPRVLRIRLSQHLSGGATGQWKRLQQ